MLLMFAAVCCAAPVGNAISAYVALKTGRQEDGGIAEGGSAADIPPRMLAAYKKAVQQVGKHVPKCCSGEARGAACFRRPRCSARAGEMVAQPMYAQLCLLPLNDRVPLDNVTVLRTLLEASRLGSEKGAGDAGTAALR